VKGVHLPHSISVRHGHPDFFDLPWGLSLTEWQGHTPRLEEVACGVSRHPVLFVNYSGRLYALKQLPADLAEVEYNQLVRLEGLRLPAVSPVGHAVTQTGDGLVSVLITRYLDRSLPFRSLFMSTSLARYRDHLLDAIAGLIVQLHLAGVFWGDCSLSNTLYRRDAGALRAYLVDAETAEIKPGVLPPELRHQDLDIMEENINGDISDLGAADLLVGGMPLEDTGASIRIRYQNLWEEITRPVTIGPEEHYKIQERIRALNSLGFSIGEMRLEDEEQLGALRLQVVVTDRNFHRDQLLELTGIEAEEMQARQMMNEIQELKATLSHANNRSTPLGAAAYYWLQNIYQPTLAMLQEKLDSFSDPAEVYCEVLEHKWYLSERAGRDVGHQAAVEDYLKRESEGGGGGVTFQSG
jgi:hypothetical protein